MAQLEEQALQKRRSLVLWSFLLLVGVAALVGLLLLRVRGQLP